MAITRTPRVGLEQWSSGQDSPSRIGFNTDFSNVETRVALDQRTPGTALPSSGLVAAELFERTIDLGGGVTGYHLYRTDAGATWRAQTWIPDRLVVRPPDTSPAVTAEALRVEHTSVANGPGLSTSWDGGMTVRRQLILGGSADGTIGRLSVGGLDAMPSGVRARITPLGAEAGLEIRAGDSNVTALLRGLDSSGSQVLTVSGAGQLTSTQGAAFGGTNPSSSAGLTVGPQSSGAINTGLLGYGQESAPTRLIAQLNRFQPGSSDAAAILSVAPNQIIVGRVGTDWTGELDLGAALTRLVTPRLAWFPTAASQSGSTPFAPFPGMTGFVGMDQSNGLSSIVGSQLHNYGAPSRDGLTLSSYSSTLNTWSGNLLSAYQAEIVSGSPSTALVTQLNPFGQLSVNAPWRGSGNKPVHLRDTRQYIVHTCKRKWADPGDYNGGQFVGSNTTFTYTWPTMTVRSASITQLEVEMRMELLFFKQNSGANPDRQVAQVRWYYQLGAGSFTLAESDYQEGASTVVDSTWPQAPGLQNTWTVVVPVTAAAGQTFRMRMVIYIYQYACDAKLRRADLKVRESIVEVYSPSE